MTIKINIGTETGKTYNLEIDESPFVEKKLGEEILGESFNPDLNGYVFEITGASDKSGFTSMKGVQGISLKKVLLTYGKGFKKRPRREGKKSRTDFHPKGLRLRKTVRGEVISSSMRQVNLKILKSGEKKLEEIFSAPEQPQEA
jgi:small subunit ribosomal protein S6e